MTVQEKVDNTSLEKSLPTEDVIEQIKMESFDILAIKVQPSLVADPLFSLKVIKRTRKNKNCLGMKKYECKGVGCG